MRRFGKLFVFFGIALLGTTMSVTHTHGQLWLEFAHPSGPHLDPGMVDPNVTLITPELFQASGDTVVVRPTLVVLMEWSDMSHRWEHDVNFWRDLVFGDPRPGIRPSVAEIFRENSNGRLLLVPALAGDIHDGVQDGVVGWVATAESSTVLVDPSQKRAEGIRVADPFFEYHLYDNNSDGQIISRELAVLVVFADNADSAATCDQHDLGHIDPPHCEARSGGNCRPTDPRHVDVDADSSPVQVYQLVAGVGEIAHVAVVAHELCHSILGHGDLYEPNGAVHVADGYIHNNVWYPPPPGQYSLMGSYWVNHVPHLDPWAKIHHGFTKPVVVTHDGTYTLYDVETERNFSAQDLEPEALIIYDPLPTDPYKEYFILENRNKAALPDRGVAVWLIDEDEPGWPYDLNFKLVDRHIRRAGYWVGDNVVLWDSADGYALTDTSEPRNTRWADGTSSHIEISDFSPADSVITFKVTMTPIFVDWDSGPFYNGSYDLPFDEVSDAIAAIPEGPRTIKIAGGNYAEPMVINTPCTLKGWRNGNAIIGQ